MNTLSDVTAEEIKELLESIREKTSNLDIDDETVRKWSREDIDRLLSVTRRDKANSAISEEETEKSEDDEESIYIAAESFEEDFPISDTHSQTEENAIPVKPVKAADRIKAIMDGESEPVKSMNLKSVMDDVKSKAFSLADKIKKQSQKFAESLKASAEEEEKRFLISDDEDDDEDFDSDDFENSDDEFYRENDAETEEEIIETEDSDDEDGDMKIADFSAGDGIENDDEAVLNEKTIFIEKPGIIYKKSESEEDTELEGVPTIISADDALANDKKAKIPTIEKMENNLHNKLREAENDGQMIISGFENSAETEESPEEIEEDEAEKALFEKRKKKIASFTLFGDDSDPYGSDAEKERIGELFDTHDERPERTKETAQFDGLEYAQTKDARRVQRYLNMQKKKSFNRVIIQCALFVLSIITGIASSVITTVGGDRIITIFVSLLTIMAALVTSGQNILGSLELFRKKKLNVNSMISIASITCFIQTLLMFVLYFFHKNSVSVFAGTGVGLLLLGELNSFVMNSRTADIMELCSGENKDKLYSIESISDDKDSIELGKNIRSKSPRIRYSCKTRFPSHLIEMCMSETSVDRRTRLMLIVITAMALINMIITWIINTHFAVGFAAFTITLSMCVPAYGSLLIQLPLRWVNRRLNKTGAMISCQDAVNELYRTNAIILDSKDLFDQNACAMLGFKDFKNVRMDDAMLYAAAMVIRSGGPLTGVFDQMVVNRRDILPTVKSFSYEEKMGVSGWIYNQKVILGNKTLMLNHNIEVPASVDEDKYLMRGHEVLYLAIAHKLAAMIVVDYAPSRKIAPYLKKLRDSGVSILVRNCDPNVTERMISTCYDMRLDNIRIINSSSGRVFKKYKSRPKASTRAVSIHDGSTYTFIRSLCTSAILRHSFKVTDMLTAIGIFMGFAVVLIFAVLNVISDMPAIFVMLMQAVISAAFLGIVRVTCGK